MKMEVFIAPSGRLFLDLIFTGFDRPPMLGEEHYAKNFASMLGGTFNTARAFLRLGIDAHLAADVGTDLPSRIVREQWDAEGAPATFRREIDGPAAAITCSFSMECDRALLSYVDELPPPDSDPEILVRHAVRHMVMPGFPPDEGLLPMMRKARELGVPIYLDGQFTERSAADPLVSAHLSIVNYFMCNELEAAALSGKSDPAEAAVFLEGIAPAAIVKCGACGAVMVKRGEITLQPAPKVEVVDTTGAGDCFVAGFVCAKIHGMDDRTALRFAVATGSLTCTGMGGGATPTFDEVQRMLGDSRW